MFTYIIIAFAGLLIAALLVTWSQGFLRRNRLHTALNIAEGTHEGAKSYLADAAITVRHLLYAIGSSARHIAVCAANAIPIGTVSDEVATADIAADPKAVELLGISSRTMLMVAAEEIVVGEAVFTAAGGKIQDLPTAGGTYYQVGYALTAASGDGVLCEVLHHAPIARVVT